MKLNKTNQGLRKDTRQSWTQSPRLQAAPRSELLKQRLEGLKEVKTWSETPAEVPDFGVVHKEQEPQSETHVGHR